MLNRVFHRKYPMDDHSKMAVGQAARLFLLAFAAMFVVSMFQVAEAEASTRTLKFYNVHTKERAKIVYKKNGKYISSGLRKVNHILRDWRAKQPTKMDPKLLDLLWTVYRQSGSKDYIHIISGYRSSSTNAMLRRTRGGQARKSQHMLGKALDFYLPDVKLSKLRALGLKLHGGGVGYYPRSGSPFVHLDTGNVRHWPRMTRRQLVSVFPKGDTIHVPTDGKPLARYKQTLAAVQKRKRTGGGVITKGGDSPKKKTLFAALFGGGADEEEDVALPAPKLAKKPAVKPKPAAPVGESYDPEAALNAVIASLPNRGPLTTTSPRRPKPKPEAVETFVPVVETPEEAPVVQPEEAPVAQPEEVLVAVNVPRPTPRPSYTPEAAIPVDSSSPAPETAPEPTPEVVPTPDVVLAALENKRPSGAAVLNETFGSNDAPELPETVLRSAFRPLDGGLDNTLALQPELRPEIDLGTGEAVFATLPETAPTPIGKSSRVSTKPLPKPTFARKGPIGRSVITGVQTTAKTSKLVVAKVVDASRFGDSAAAMSSNAADLASKLKLYAEKRLKTQQ